MIIELIFSRGMTFIVDGQEPDNGNWGWGDDDTPDGAITISGLTIASLEPTRLLFDDPSFINEYYPGQNEPKTLNMTTKDGQTVTLNVTEVIVGTDEQVGEDEWGVKKTLTTGETVWLDPYQLYVKAEA